MQAPVTINTTTVAQDKTVTYGAASVLLTATVTPATGPSGTVTFTVNGSSVTSGPVSAGNASASFTLSGLNGHPKAHRQQGNHHHDGYLHGRSVRLHGERANAVLCDRDRCGRSEPGRAGHVLNNVSAGTATANASFAENTNYLASSDSENFTIGLAELTITAADQTKTYGDTSSSTRPPRPTDFSVVGLVNGDTVTSVTLTSAGAAASATVAGRPYDIVAERRRRHRPRQLRHQLRRTAP